MPIHNKLVRDKVPEIIEESGKHAIFSMLTENEFKNALRNKAKEELEEYLNAKTEEEALEELADLLEVMDTLTRLHGSSIEEVETIRKKKTEVRGSFEDRVFLIEVQDCNSGAT